jgi:hypothetical protein
MKVTPLSGALPFSIIIDNSKAVYIIQTVEAGVQDIPPLLQGHSPPSKELANIGTQNYGRKVAAVVVGGGYNDNDFEELRKSVGQSHIPWLRHDISMDIDPRQPRPKIGIQYGEQIGQKALRRL